MLLLAVGLAGACHTVFDGELGNFACAEEGAYGPPACRERETCVQGACIDVGASFGGACAADSDCGPETFCFDPASIGATGARRCTRICCASTECGPSSDGLVCWMPAGGAGGLCWPAEEQGRGTPGDAPAGTACAEGIECRSGTCDRGRCVDACCGDGYCGAQDELCRVKPIGFAVGDTWACGQPPGGTVDPACDTDDDCPTGRCMPVIGGVLGCAEQCCSSEECGTVVDAMSVLHHLVCRPVGGTLRACSQPVTLALDARGVGASCTDDRQCRSALCVREGESGFCSDHCCHDAGCGDTSRFACRPLSDGTNWALRCVRK